MLAANKIPHWAASKGLRNYILSVLVSGTPRAQHHHGCVLLRAFSWVADLVSSCSGTQRELCGVSVLRTLILLRALPS